MAKIATIELEIDSAPAAGKGLAHLAVVGSTSPGLTLSGLSWAAQVQTVRSVGAVIDAGDAGELAVKLFGPALEELADS